MAFHEYDRIVDAIGAKVPYWTTLLATLLVCAMVPFQWVDLESILAASLLLIALNVLASDRVGTPLLADTAAAMLAPVYIGLPLGCLVGVHAIAGREAVLLLIATVAVSDTAQYYTGRTLGRTPLAPLRSPKKTREGARRRIRGRAGVPRRRGVVFSAGISRGGGTPALGLGIVVAGIIGDLFESMLKRAADMKDSGTLIPGHGGVLDQDRRASLCCARSSTSSCENMSGYVMGYNGVPEGHHGYEGRLISTQLRLWHPVSTHL